MNNDTRYYFATFAEGLCRRGRRQNQNGTNGGHKEVVIAANMFFDRVSPAVDGDIFCQCISGKNR